MYLDTPTQLPARTSTTTSASATRRSAATIIGNKETVRAATRETFTRLPRPLVRRPRAPSSVSAARVDGLGDRGGRGAVRHAARGRERADFEPFDAGRRIRACGSTRRTPTSSTCASAATGCRSVHPDRYIAQCSRDGARRRHVVAPLHRGARAPRARLLRRSPSTASTSTPARSSRRPASTSSARTRPCARSSASCAELRERAACPTTSWRRPQSYLKGRLVLGLEDPRSIVGFGLRGDSCSRARRASCRGARRLRRRHRRRRRARRADAARAGGAAHRRDRPDRRRVALRGAAALARDRRGPRREPRRPSADRPRTPRRAPRAAPSRPVRASRGSRSPRRA